MFLHLTCTPFRENKLGHPETTWDVPVCRTVRDLTSRSVRETQSRATFAGHASSRLWRAGGSLTRDISHNGRTHGGGDDGPGAAASSPADKAAGWSRWVTYRPEAITRIRNERRRTITHRVGLRYGFNTGRGGGGGGGGQITGRGRPRIAYRGERTPLEAGDWYGTPRDIDIRRTSNPSASCNQYPWKYWVSSVPSWPPRKRFRIRPDRSVFRTSKCKVEINRPSDFGVINYPPYSRRHRYN